MQALRTRTTPASRGRRPRTFEIDLAKPRSTPRRPTLGRCEPACPPLVPRSRRRLLQPSDPRAQRHHAEHLLRLSRPRRLPSRRSPARESSPGRSGPTSRSAPAVRPPAPGPIPPTYTHTIKEPTNPVSSAGANRLVMSWDAKTGTKQYRVQISKREDFNPVHRDEDDRQSRLRAPAHLVVLQRGRRLLLARRRDRRRRERGHLRQQPGARSHSPRFRAAEPGRSTSRSPSRAVSSRTATRDIAVKVRDCHDSERPPGRPRARLRRRRVADPEDHELERRRQVPPQADAAQEGHVPGEQAHATRRSTSTAACIAPRA